MEKHKTCKAFNGDKCKKCILYRTTSFSFPNKGPHGRLSTLGKKSKVKEGGRLFIFEKEIQNASIRLPI